MEPLEATVVDLVWGDPPEASMALLHRWTADGAILSDVTELHQANGYFWVCRHAVSSIVEQPADAPAVRYINAMGVRRDRTIGRLDSIDAVLELAIERSWLLMFQDYDGGPSVGLVGRPIDVLDGFVRFADVDTDGAFTGETVSVKISELDRVVWCDDYLQALEFLASNPA